MEQNNGKPLTPLPLLNSLTREEIQVKAKSLKPSFKTVLLVINCLLLFVGVSGGPLVMRLYFLKGGSRKWLTTWLETGGWPFMLLPLTISYFLRRRGTISTDDGSTKLIVMKLPLFIFAVIVGLLTGLDNYMYTIGVERLPVSTTSLIASSQLVFTAVFAFWMVKQKFTAYSINSVFLLVLGSVVLGIHTSGDRPKGESSKQYFLGFFMVLASAALYGFVLPLVELMYKKAKQVMTYTLVMEFQMIMCLFATLFCTVGMLVNKDFQAISNEAKHFELGEARYYVVLVASAILWNCSFLGVVGVIFCSSSLLSGIIIAMALPVTEVLGVLFYHEKFQSDKGIVLVLCLWGFVSYFFGEAKQNKKEKEEKRRTLEAELATSMAV